MGGGGGGGGGSCNEVREQHGERVVCTIHTRH